MATHKKDVPAWTRNRVEKILERLDDLEKVAGAQNEQLVELRRSNEMMVEALRQLATDEEADYAVALSQLTAVRRRG